MLSNFKQILDGTFPDNLLLDKKEVWNSSRELALYLKDTKLSDKEGKNISDFMVKIHPILRIHIWGGLQNNLENLLTCHTYCADTIIETATGKFDAKEDVVLLERFMACKNEMERNLFLKENGFID